MSINPHIFNAHTVLLQEIRNAARPLTGSDEEYKPLLDKIGNAKFVLMGESTHGSSEFYQIRSQLTQELIQHYGFCAVAMEADWPDSYRVNRYVRGDETITTAESALVEFTRFPNWMWRNEVNLAFIKWLREYNQALSLPQEKIGYYGLDVYSLHASINAVIAYLDNIDQEAAKNARDYYGCFGDYAKEPQEYGLSSILGITPSCEEEVVKQLVMLRHHTDVIDQDYPLFHKISEQFRNID